MRIIILLLVIWGSWPSTGYAQLETEALTAQQEFFAELPTGELNNVISQLNSELEEPIPVFSWEEIKQIAENGLLLNGDQLVKRFASLMLQEIHSNMSLLGKLICIAAVCALLRNLELAYKGSDIARLSYSLCFAAMLVLGIKVLYSGILLAKTTIDGMVSLMNALLPIFITLLTASGNIAASALLSPLMIFAVNSISFITDKLVVPLLVMSAVLECTNYIAMPYKLNGLAKLIKQSGLMIIGFMMMLFIGILAVQGTAGAVSDGLTLRTAKFATASFVPVVGKVLSDTVELLFSASLLLRSSIGRFGVLAVFSLCFAPCLKIFIIGLLVKLSGVCIEPLGDNQLAGCMGAIGNNLYILAAVMLVIAMMFFLMLVMFIFSGGITAAVK